MEKRNNLEYGLFWLMVFFLIIFVLFLLGQMDLSISLLAGIIGATITTILVILFELLSDRVT